MHETAHNNCSVTLYDKYLHLLLINNGLLLSHLKSMGTKLSSMMLWDQTNPNIFAYFNTTKYKFSISPGLSFNI